MPEVKELDRDMEDIVEFEMEDDAISEGNTYQKDVHHMVRGISKRNIYIEAHDSAYFPSKEIDAQLTHWIDQGYEIRNVFYLGEAPEGYHMMYILVR